MRASATLQTALEWTPNANLSNPLLTFSVLLLPPTPQFPIFKTEVMICPSLVKTPRSTRKSAIIELNHASGFYSLLCCVTFNKPCYIILSTASPFIILRRIPQSHPSCKRAKLQRLRYWIKTTIVSIYDSLIAQDVSSRTCTALLLGMKEFTVQKPKIPEDKTKNLGCFHSFKQKLWVFH